MARKHYWQFLVTDEGNPIENASISIFEAGSENPVWVFTDEIGGSGTASNPQVNTSKKGFFEFWIATDNEANGYPISTKFKVAWSAPGVSGGYIDYVDVFSTAVEPVLLGDTNPDLNKAVSNALATGWEDHKNHDVTVDATNIHGIYPVDVGSVNTTPNKMVSDFYAKRWIEHESSDWTGAFDIFAPPTNPHGILEVDATDGSSPEKDDKNKLVSNQMAKDWNDHVANIDPDPHPQYSLLDGTKPYTAPVGYDGSVLLGSISADDFITRGMIDETQEVAVIENTGSTNPDIGSKVGGTWYLQWILDGDGTYYADFPHSLNINYPISTVWQGNEEVMPLEIERIDPDTTRFRVTLDLDHAVRVTGQRF